MYFIDFVRNYNFMRGKFLTTWLLLSRVQQCPLIPHIIQQIKAVI